MQLVLLAGGLGTRLSEETTVRPKPMVEIGGMPVLWHIMKIYSAHGINDFIVCSGYKGHMIKEYFASYYMRMADVTFDLRSNRVTMHDKEGAEPWSVTVVDTGADTMTGGRLRRAAPYIKDETFCLTYGDGVSNIDITALIAFHKQHGKRATLTAVQPGGRFGMITLEGDQITHFKEKPVGDGGWVNGGYFVLQRDVIEYIDGDSTVWENGPLQRLAHEGQLCAYQHPGFWQPMDTLRDKDLLEQYWRSGKAPWKVWR
jgi:glucose-1-phosphate cytidylyltransferase